MAANCALLFTEQDKWKVEIDNIWSKFLEPTKNICFSSLVGQPHLQGVGRIGVFGSKDLVKKHFPIGSSIIIVAIYITTLCLVIFVFLKIVLWRATRPFERSFGRGLSEGGKWTKGTKMEQNFTLNFRYSPEIQTTIRKLKYLALELYKTPILFVFFRLFLT